jgi:hypothetical protein
MNSVFAVQNTKLNHEDRKEFIFGSLSCRAIKERERHVQIYGSSKNNTFV